MINLELSPFRDGENTDTVFLMMFTTGKFYEFHFFEIALNICILSYWTLILQLFWRVLNGKVGHQICNDYSKTCLKRPLKNRQNNGFKDKW